MVPKTHMFAFLFFLISFNLFSQETTEKKPKIKNEIAIDASPILGTVLKQNNLPGVFYRRHFKNSALRIKGNFFIDNGDRNTVNNNNQGNSNNSPTENKTRTTQIDYSIGVQTAKNITEHWMFYYGLDLYSGYSQSTSYSKNQLQQYDNLNGNYYLVTSTQDISNKSVYGGISPFFGFTWQMTSRLGISIEANAPIGFYRTKSNQTIFTPATTFAPEISNRNTTISTNFRARLVPVSNLAISYYF